MFDLFYGDCFNVFETIPKHSVDLILTDPPYGLREYSTGNMHFNWRATLQNDIEDWDSITYPPELLLPHFQRILKPTGNIFIFCSYNQLGDYHRVFNPVYDTFQMMVWHKTNPTPQIRKSSFLNSCELIACAWNKGHVWNFSKQNEMHNFIESPIVMGKERLEKRAQKPVKVLSKIIEIASCPDAIVFDPFMGVGSTGEAALRLGRKFIGCEANSKDFIKAEKRLKEIS